MKMCKICKSIMYKPVKYSSTQWAERQYCSKQCTVKGTGNLRKANNQGSNHYLWKGKNVGYMGVHAWVRKRLPKPAFCEKCGIVPPRDLANKGIYDRNLYNWEYLCRRCHMLSDGRLEKLKITQFKPHAQS